MTFKKGDIVLHKTDKTIVGIITSSSNVEWWSLSTDSCCAKDWYYPRFTSYVLHYKDRNTTPLPQFLSCHPNFKKRAQQFESFFGTIYKETDSPLVKKIKELDYQWELRMKERGTFYLTSRVLTVDQETTSEPIQTDTVTVSAATSITPLVRTITTQVILDDYIETSRDRFLAQNTQWGITHPEW